MLISSSKLKQVKNCKTAWDVWVGRHNSPSMPARTRTKSDPLKRLILKKLRSIDDARGHLISFMDNADKLNDLGVEINEDLLLSIIML